LIVVTLPRFNWGEVGSFSFLVGVKPVDVIQYETYTKYFRHNPVAETKLEAPFSYRPLAPFIASFLPFKPLTSINIINLLALILTVLVLSRLLKIFNFDDKYNFYGLLIFVLSFPVFYYGTSGYIDSVLIFFLTGSVYFLFAKKKILFLTFFLLGISVKETMVIMLPVAAVFLYFQKEFNLKQKIFFITLLTIFYFAEVFLLRHFTPGKETYVWMPKTEILLFNLFRIKTYLSIIITFGIPGFGALLFLKCSSCFKQLGSMSYVLLTGASVALLISIFSLFSAYADGRHLWTSYPFTIPLAVGFLQNFIDQKKEKV